jgi:hypothetical protein
MICRHPFFPWVSRSVSEAREYYLYSEIEGESFEYEEIRELFQGIIAECSDLEQKKAVVVNKIPAAATNSALFALILSIGESRLKGLRLAIVDSDHRDMDDFGNLVAQNRSIEMRFFTNVRSAEVWLGLDRDVTDINDTFWPRIDLPDVSIRPPPLQ